MRHTNRTLLVDGGVYPEGTAEKDLPKGEDIDDAFFAGDADADAPFVRISADYDEAKVEDLKTEIGLRNEDLGDEAQIVVEGKGIKADLVKALAEHDARTAGN